MKRLFSSVLCVTLCTFCSLVSARAQTLQTVAYLTVQAPPIAQQTQPPTFDATMVWVKQKVETEAHFSSHDTITVEDPNFGHTVQFDDIVVYSYKILSAANCQMTWQSTDSYSGNNYPNDIFTIDFTKLDPAGIAVKPFNLPAVLGAGPWTRTRDGASGMITRVPIENATWEVTGFEEQETPKLEPGGFVFTDNDMAARMAAALKNAVQVCGGKPEIF